MMHITSTLTYTWAALLLATTLVMVCRATVTQHETDQLFLSDEESVSLNNQEHHRLLRIVALLRPLCQVLGGSTIAVSALIAGMYVVQMWPYVHFFQR
jgi:hypothetical protein